MPLPDIDWVTHAPTGLDDLGTDMPDVVNDSVPGALDGHRIRASMLNETRDKLDYVYREVGTKPGNEPAGCLRERVDSLEGSVATDEKVKVSAIDDPASYLADKVIGTGGIIETTVDKGGGDLAVQLTPDYGTTSGKVCQGNDSRLPTSDEKAALAGTGVPSGSNKYVTDDDARLIGSTTDEKVKVTTNDTTPNFLDSKITAVNGIQKSVTDPSGDEGLQLTPDYGSLANTVCEGNDSRLSDSRVPTGSAGGQLGGTYPNPDVRGIRTTDGPTLLTLGAVTDGQYLKRSGTSVVGDTPSTGAGSDTTAIHDNVAAEINAIGTEENIINTSLVIYESASDSWNKYKAEIGDLPVTDQAAIHTDVSGEFGALTLLGSPLESDYLLLEQAATPWNKYKIEINSLPVATTFENGYMPQLSGNSGQYLNGNGGWSIPFESGGSYSISASGTLGLTSVLAMSLNCDDDIYIMATDTGGTINLTANTEIDLTAATIDINATTFIDLTATSAPISIGAGTTLGLTSVLAMSLNSNDDIYIMATNTGKEITLTSDSKTTINGGSNIVLNGTGTIELNSTNLYMAISGSLRPVAIKSFNPGDGLKDFLYLI